MGKRETSLWSKKISEEEIAEYMARKAQKKTLKVAKKLMKVQTVSGYYSNDSNPFGDSNLNQIFVWKKKIDRDVSQGVPLVQLFPVLKAEKRKQIERMAEIEKAKKKREERAIEKAQQEELMSDRERDRARAEFQDWEKKEAEFLFCQSRMRSEIRLREGRAKPIDILTKHLYPNSDDFINEPYDMVFKDLSVKELEELRDEIKMRLDFDRETTTSIDYWEALLVVCDWELAEARKKNARDQARVSGEQLPEERGLHSFIEADVKNLLEGKNYDELDALHSQIESQMRSGAAKVVEFWEVVLKRIHIYKANARLKKFHTKMSQKHMASAGVSKEQQRRTQEAKMASMPTPPAEENLEIMKAMKAMGTREEGDVVFGSGAEINLDSQVYLWHDKYPRPRKPKYLNRVHTGYEWNRYNRTHYDHDNPPPKIVQGYKFNIFYPDLVDKIRAPSYAIEKDGDSAAETCIIRFHAGPPYEDIAFRIVNKEWEYSRKKGFKCTFEQGILRVYFNIKRYRYRR